MYLAVLRKTGIPYIVAGVGDIKRHFTGRGGRFYRTLRLGVRLAQGRPGLRFQLPTSILCPKGLRRTGRLRYAGQAAEASPPRLGASLKGGFGRRRVEKVWYTVSNVCEK